MAKAVRAVTKVKNIYLTSKGLQELHIELDYLKDVKRNEITERIQRAREFGDLAENVEFDSALEEQQILEGRISELEKIISDAKIIKDQPLNNDIVTIGSTVVVNMDGEVDEFTIVGRLEANPAKKMISNESPVGAALIGAHAGEEIEVVTPIIKYKAKVLEIK